MARTGGEFGRLAGKYLGKQAKALRRELPRVRARKDIEPIHQVRVAARRLRVGLDLFAECLPAKKVKRWRRAAKRLLKALGPARDGDVQIAFVRGIAATLRRKAYRPGVARLLLRLEQARDGLQKDVVQAADRFEAAGVVDEVLAASPRTPVGTGGPAESPCEAVLRRSSPEIQQRIRKMLALQPGLEDPEDIKRHHAMRIATKRLRYVLEACCPACGRRIARYVSAAKKVQTLLGDIHECDVWGEQLRAFLKEEEARTVAYFGRGRPMRRLRAGIEHLREDRRARRQRLFKQLTRAWRRLDRQGLWGSLGRLAEDAASPAPPKPVPAAPRRSPAPARAGGTPAAPGPPSITGQGAPHGSATA